MLITQEYEHSLIEDLLVKIKYSVVENEDYFANKSLIINVSPDYSSIISMRLAHGLSKDGEMAHIIGLDTAYSDDTKEKIDSYKMLAEGLLGVVAQSKAFTSIFVASSEVETGDTFSRVYSKLKEATGGEVKLYTVALVERNSSKFQSDFVGLYSETPVRFWWESENKHRPAQGE
jgi:hypothetical protein